jgi:hypothetical protein
VGGDELGAGVRVRRASTGEDGVVLAVGAGALVQVAFPSGTFWVHPGELEKLPEGPIERLTAGEVGQVEPYGLRRQSLCIATCGASSPGLRGTGRMADCGRGAAAEKLGRHPWPTSRR